MEIRPPTAMLSRRYRRSPASAIAARTWRLLVTPAWVGLMMLLVGCVGSGDRPLQLMSGAGPVYPAAAKDSGIEGEVLVRYRVSSTGVVTDVVVVEATPPQVFDQAAITAVQQFRYRPKQIAGQAVAVPAVTSTIRFRLDSGDQYPSPPNQPEDQPED